MGIEMKSDETAYRCNVVTLSEEEEEYEDRIILDHSADEITTEEADKLIKDRFNAWSAECGRETLGYFGTTPFFMGYIDEAVSAKKLHYSYPLYLFATYLGNDANEYKETFSKDGYGLYIEDFTV